MINRKNIVTLCLMIVVIPSAVIAGALLFRDKNYNFISLCVAVLSCIPLLYSFENKKSSSKELAILAVMIAISTVGRFVFAWLPAFKPVTAITIIAAVMLGKEAGFVIGSISAVVSNFYFGQGPWTPFQMFAWGFIGFMAGILAAPIKKNKVVMCIYGALSGVVFSMVMDIWTALWADGYLNLSRYIAIMATSLPAMIMYAVSNVIFLLILFKPIGEKLQRVKIKYGLFKN